MWAISLLFMSNPFATGKMASTLPNAMLLTSLSSIKKKDFKEEIDYVNSVEKLAFLLISPVMSEQEI